MSLTNVTPAVLLAGLLGLAALLFLMQRLRVRHRRVPVITTLFWQEAIEEARARRFVKRFRHPWAYALIVLIAALLWFAYAEPSSKDPEAPRQVLLLDASAGMSAPGRFVAAKERLESVLKGLRKGDREVILCGAVPTTLLAPGEEAALLPTRLEGVSPEACPPTLESALRLFARTPESRRVDVTVFGDAPVRKETLALLSSSVRVRRFDSAERPAIKNRGVVAAGVGPSSSGAFDRVDVRVEITGVNPSTVLSVTLDDVPLEDGLRLSEETNTSLVLTIVDLPARGQRLRVASPGSDEIAADDAVEILLPERSLLRVTVSPTVPKLVRSVLLADQAVVVTDDDAIVAVRSRGDGHRTDLPSLEFVPSEEQEQAIVLHHANGDDSRVILERVFDRLGLDQVDMTDAATELARPIVLGVVEGDQRRVAVWQDLVGEGYNFVKSRSFPLFVAQSIRWLADVSEFPRTVAAQEAMNVTGRWTDAAGRSYDPVGQRFEPPASGLYTQAGETKSVVLASRAVTSPTMDGVVRSEDVESASAIPWLTVLGLLVLVLLCAEWFFFQTGRIP